MGPPLHGVSASPGIVSGTVHLLRWEVPEVPSRLVSDAEVAGELQRLRDAVTAAIERLRVVQARAEANAGPAEAAIFEVQVAMLEDPSLQESIEALIRQNLAAEKAVDLVLLEWRERFGRSTNPLMRERTGDLIDVQIRLLTLLLGLPDHDPVAAELSAFADRAQREAVALAALSAEAVGEALTTDGHRVTLRANVDLPDEAARAVESGAEGVGLMRTEFLVVGRAAMPTEEEQVEAYRNVLRAFPGQPVVIRTYDVGGDKLPMGGFPHEPNPFLGWRAIRMCLDEPAIFSVQLRALLRVAAEGDVRIMLPLVVSVDEVRQARFLLEEAADDLARRGVPHRRDVPLGVMVETPAAAIAADTFAGEVAFLSLGTNDLVQYTLAVDRGNASLVTRFTPLHPAVLRLIARTVEAGEASGVEVSVCGEMASQPLMAFVLLGLGVRTLSVAATGIPLVKRLVRGVSVAAASAAAQDALRAATPADVERGLRTALIAELGESMLDGLLGLG